MTAFSNVAPAKELIQHSENVMAKTVPLLYPLCKWIKNDEEGIISYLKTFKDSFYSSQEHFLLDNFGLIAIVLNCSQPKNVKEMTPATW